MPDHLQTLLTTRGSASGKTNSLFNLTNQQPDIYKICLYSKIPYEAKCRFLIKKRERTGLKHFNGSKSFIDFLNGMDDITNKIEEYNPNKKNQSLFMI